ncbi:Bug family tripartite tricarboxylate transporter substrate binding protein [Cupriavidus necator]|uniref:Bug family tripartite tricarboxylate transporter substrate binding protein n=1 Tax=Cupriavidus necator TaxID=106590 RepID=UPI002782AEE2|nr:tripartite tricarboxylate transporter substrate binding protein [Cupriavidus necator]MDQ0138464.1 tripartite-type tricarboxylate transporter receptor subunit TctC [Cupriavidus necator]
MSRIATTARLLAAFALTGMVGAPHAQEPYPSRPVTIVVPYSPGGTTDIIARLAAQYLTETMGKSFVVDNRPGASGTIATALVAKAAPDGYTLLANEVGQTATPALYPNLKYDPVKDLAPITLIAETPVVLGVTQHVPANSLKELLAYGKLHPGALNFGSGGAGSGPHIAGELLKQVAGVSMTHVPYKGSGAAVTDLIAGQIQLLSSAAPTISPHVTSGKIRAFAVAGPRRVPSLPNVPTAAEAGLPAFQFSIWFGLAAPKGTPAEIINKLNGALQAMVKNPAMRDKLAAAGADPVGAGPEAFGKRIASETQRWGDLIRKSGIRVD